MDAWPTYSTDFIRHRYNRLAALYPIFDLIFWLPHGICREAVRRLELRPGQRALEVGCGRGRNFPPLLEALGPSGHLYGVDLSDGMLARARALVERRGWSNVTLLQSEATRYSLPETVDAALFSLSYEVMPDHRGALRLAWSHLRPGGRLAIVGARAHPGILGKLLAPLGVLVSRATVLGSPFKRPWEDLRELTSDVETEFFSAGSYYICLGRKVLA
jgi:demethylmenaquinone methyltransferase/2-methoxy-6-polyprenyl-1,4-benzoquinol methylase